MAASKKATVTAKASQMVKRLRNHHRLGERAKDEELSPTKIRQLNEFTLDKFRAFAEEYKPKELDALCKLRRPNGLPLHWGYIPYLLTIPSKFAAKSGLKRTSARAKAERKRFQDLAAAKGWSVGDLRAEIDAEFPKGPNTHGRRLAEPKDLFRSLNNLVRELDVLERRVPMIRELARAKKLGDVVRSCEALVVAFGKAKDELTAKTKNKHIAPRGRSQLVSSKRRPHSAPKTPHRTQGRSRAGGKRG